MNMGIKELSICVTKLSPQPTHLWPSWKGFFLWRISGVFPLLTCYIPLESPGLSPVVVGRGSLREQADSLAKLLQGCVEVPSLCCPDSLQLQGLGLLQLCLRENAICTREETRWGRARQGKKN